MREHLIRYIDLLFAGAPEAADIKQEILQNTLDRFDDLVAQGKTPEAAYQLAISGIGDINELLGTSRKAVPVAYAPVPEATPQKPVWKKALQAIGICLYILCPVPLFILQNELGLCVLLAFVAVATALMVISGDDKKDAQQQDKAGQEETPLRKAIGSVIFAVGLCVYLGLSFTTQAWYITWVIFPLMAAIKGLVNACMDLWEASDNEK